LRKELSQEEEKEEEEVGRWEVGRQAGIAWLESRVTDLCGETRIGYFRTGLVGEGRLG
jgi:hypothetical protein